jgi:hypothetical protein
VTSQTDCAFKASNTPGNFKAHLGRNLDLIGSWSVALMEVFYPNTFPNLNHDACDILCTSSESEMIFSITPGFYANSQALVNEFNRVMARHAKLSLDVHHFITLEFEPDARFQTYTFPSALVDILGFSDLETVLGIGVQHADYPCDLRRGFPQIFSIQTDLVKDQHINNRHHRVLRNFTPLADVTKYGLVTSKEFEKLVFLPVSKTCIESVSIYVADELSRPVLFTAGVTSAVLLFRRCKYGC